MTNAQLIFNASVKLMQDGTIQGTGRFFEFQDDAGEVHRIEEPEALHTYDAWRQIGRQVKRGEKCKARIDIWKMGKGKKQEEADGETEKGRFFLKTAYFFTLDQTEPITG